MTQITLRRGLVLRRADFFDPSNVGSGLAVRPSIKAIRIFLTKADHYGSLPSMKVYLALASFLILSSPTINAAEPSLQQNGSTTQAGEQSAREDLGYGMGSVVASLLYSPLKVTYAGLGLVTGGLGFLLSAGQAEVADQIIYPAVSGNYIITPRHLKGEERVVFIGPPPPVDSPQHENGSAPAVR